MTIIDQHFKSRIQEEVNFEGQNMSIEIIAHERNDSCIEQMLEETSVKKSREYSNSVADLRIRHENHACI